jgi:hypothetical protein
MSMIRDRKVSKSHPKVRLSGEKNSKQNILRYELYRYAFQRLDEASENGMILEVIALCDMLITDRIEAYCQYLLHDDELQFETMSSNQALSALGVALKDCAPEIQKSPEWRNLRDRIKQFADARNYALHSFVLIKNAAPDTSLEERINFVEDAAEDGIILVREVMAFVNKNIVLDE